MVGFHRRVLTQRNILTSQFTRYPRLIKEGGWIVIGQIAAVLGSLVLVRVLTERLHPVQYGQLALGLTVAGLVQQVVMGGMNNGISRFYPIAVEKQELSAYLHTSRILMVYATFMVLVIGFVIWSGLFFLGYTKWMGLFAAALVFSILSGYNSVLSGIQNAARQRSIVALHRGLNAWLKIMLAVAVIFWLGNSSTAVVIGYAIAALLVTASQFFFLSRLIPSQIGKSEGGTQWVQRIWAYSWPFSAWGVFTWLQLSSDRWALGVFANTQDVGFYAVLFQLGYMPIAMLTGMALSFLAPILYQRAGDGMDLDRNANVHRLTWRITLFSLLITLTAFLVTLGLHGWLFKLLVAIEYQSVSYLLPWVVLGGGMMAGGQSLTLKLQSEMRTKTMMWAKIMTALLGIMLNVYGAWAAGLQGIVTALVAFSAIYFLWMAWLAYRPMGKTA